MARAIAVAVALLVAATAQAQMVAPPPKIPDVPDVPLPEWHAPPPRKVAALFLSVSPEAESAQRLRQTGLWLASLGGAQLFAGGILFAWALDTNGTLSYAHPNVIYGPNGSYMTTVTNVFDPSLEDQRNRILDASRALFITGGAFTVAGFVVFGIGQARLAKYHERRPKEPLPPLSGYSP